MRAVIATGERVWLCSLKLSDREEFLRAVAASVGHHRPWVYAPANREQWSAYARKRNADDARAMVVRRRDDGALVGVINLNNIIGGGLQQAFVGYYALAPHLGSGYMTEGLKLVVEHAFVDLRLHRLEANIQPGNEPSKKLASRVGFRYEGFSPRYLQVGGEWRDHERWAMVSDDQPEVRNG